MFCSNYNINESYKEYLVEDLKIYEKNCMYYNHFESLGVLKNAIEMSNPRDEIYKVFKSLRNYKKNINNITSAKNLKSLDPSEIKDLDNYANRIYEKEITLIDPTEIQNIKSGKTLLRLNDESQIIYTVSKVGDRFVFKNFNLIEVHVGVGYSVKLFLRSVWYVKQQLPDIKKFKSINRGISSIDDVIKIDPNFRCCEKNGALYSTHFFGNEEGYVITIKYSKDFKGRYRVENIKLASEGFSLFPYLLPVDKKLIDPNYTPEPERASEYPPDYRLEDAYTPKNSSYCNIM